jgi:pimeloyl-ACP methyl ester carboxylesterase
MPDATLTLSNGRTLGYAEHGDPDGVVAFFCHGWPSGRSQGALLDDAGKRHGVRVITPDRPGIGLSDSQPGRTLMAWPETQEELAAHLGADRYHLFGWSGGGPYVLASALRHPDRLLSASIICGAPPLSFFGDQEMFWLYRLMIRLRQTMPSVLSVVLKMGEVASRGSIEKPPLKWFLGLLGEQDRRVLLDPEVFEVVRAGILECLGRGPKEVIADADICLNEWGFEVSQVDYPIHFWHGKDDRNIA